MALVIRSVSQCCGLRGHSSILHGLGLLLTISGVFRFWLHFQPSTSLLLLLFNWIICIVLECVAVEIFFQIPWNSLKLQKVTSLRYFVLVALFTMGLINVHSTWQLCTGVRDCVLELPEYGWTAVVLLWLAMITAMSHSIELGELECSTKNFSVNRAVIYIVNWCCYGIPLFTISVYMVKPFQHCVYVVPSG